MAIEEGADLLLELLVLIRSAQRLLLIIEGTTRQFGELQQASQRE
jgi:hypothetical protein